VYICINFAHVHPTHRSISHTTYPNALIVQGPKSTLPLHVPPSPTIYNTANTPIATAANAPIPISTRPAAPVPAGAAAVPVAAPVAWVARPVGPETSVLVIAAVLVQEQSESNEADV